MLQHKTTGLNTTTQTAVYQENEKHTHTAQDCKGHTLNELGSIWYTYSKMCF